MSIQPFYYLVVLHGLLVCRGIFWCVSVWDGSKVLNTFVLSKQKKYQSKRLPGFSAEW